MSLPRLNWMIPLVVLAAAVRAFAFDITACDQTISGDEIGTLVADLDCPGPASRGVRMEGGILEMNGFSIRGDGRGVGVECVSVDGRGHPNCAVRGPGEITGFEIGINGAGCTVSVEQLAVRENMQGIALPLSGLLTATDLTVSDGGLAIWVDRLRGDRVIVRDNTGDGVNVNRTMRLRHLTAISNGAAGVRARHGRLVDSLVLGSGGFDVLASGRLRIVRTACETGGRIKRRPPHAGKVVRTLPCQTPR